ncbi:hypothetical protein GUITHDRAFT_120817 [Guillardia theta CCMP2712]|uniref:Cyclin N-terminal domain-containing protein n=1 Tax=Guillardia theta (strain CCMP2712) TaxID=905079 RepID=L1I9Q5_GUITC|nr:hypothetical protein GUITHDRAFT_120817 [Guillardia theta CCMP2712]EKX32986.1 hypothetical protein GUITHDRAFT_120817 [Guillardia theta CCMP2712]|eukprot:XP_005819966.1 hypothetical protein GUITHDRAFT_120817 [Guillardia theta CCMP2712]
MQVEECRGSEEQMRHFHALLQDEVELKKQECTDPVTMIRSIQVVLELCHSVGIMDDMDSEVIALSMNYLQRCSQNEKLVQSFRKSVLLPVACMLTALKLCETYAVRICDLVPLLQPFQVDEDEIRDAEWAVLEALDFNLQPVTTSRLLSCVLDLAPETKRNALRDVADIYLKLSHLIAENHVKPSVIVSAILWNLAREKGWDSCQCEWIPKELRCWRASSSDDCCKDEQHVAQVKLVARQLHMFARCVGVDLDARREYMGGKWWFSIKSHRAQQM